MLPVGSICSWLVPTLCLSLSLPHSPLLSFFPLWCRRRSDSFPRPLHSSLFSPLKSLEFHHNTLPVGIASPNFHPSSMLSTLSSWWISPLIANSRLPHPKPKHTPSTTESRRPEFPIHLGHLLLNIGKCKLQDIALLLGVVLKSAYTSQCPVWHTLGAQ